MQDIGCIGRWDAFRLDVDLEPGWWAFNPSVIRMPDGMWLCSARAANYHLPGSTIAPEQQPSPLRNRCVMLEVDPLAWRTKRQIEMVDLDAECGAYRSSAVFGFEDIRLVHTERDGLFAIGNSLTLNDQGTIEVCRLSLCQETFQILGVEAFRGSSWMGQHQKNWSAWQHQRELRMLFSVTEGGIHDRNGRIFATHKPPMIDPPKPPPELAKKRHGSSHRNGSMEVQITPARHRTAAPRQHPFTLRGGTQILNLGSEAEPRWIGLAHGCAVSATKLYWHRFYEVNLTGELLALSRPYKLAPGIGIEFAAGMAHDPSDRDVLAISFGIEDDSAWIGEIARTAALEALLPVDEAIKP